MELEAHAIDLVDNSKLEISDNSDRETWDRRYAEGGRAPVDQIGPYPLFAPFEDGFPKSGKCLELACGRGRGAVWLATRGVNVFGVDFSPVAIDLARDYAEVCGVSDLCSFAVHDLDDGLPDVDQVDLIMCYLFRDPVLNAAIVERLKPGAMLAIAVLSEVGAGPGRFRVKQGELLDAFADLDIAHAGEADGHAWLIGHR